MRQEDKHCANRLHKILKTCASSGVMAWALMSGLQAFAGPDACTIDATTITCEGDQSAGIGFGSNVHNVLNIRNLTQDITPANHEGLYFINTATDITVNSDLGEYRMETVNGWRGIWLRANYGDITLNHKGDIETSGAYGTAIQLDSNGNAGANPIMTVNTTGGHIQTSGDYAHGMYLYSAGPGQGIVDNAADITTAGNTSRGIFVFAGGNSSASNSGTITTLGADSEGVYLSSILGDTSFLNTGHIETSGTGARGFHIVTQNGTANVDQLGTILTAGDYSHGFIAATGRGDLIVNMSGSVETQGREASGLYLSTNYGTADINVSGDVTTSGIGGLGVRSEAIESLQNVHLTSGGSITTTGRYSDGIYLNTFATSEVGTSTIQIDGSIQTSGENAEGLNGQFYQSPVSTSVNGDINTQGLHAYGVVIQSNNGAADFAMGGTGSIVTRGVDSVGLYHQTTGDFTNTVALGPSTSIRTSGSGAHGIWAISGGAFDFTNDGMLTVGGSSANALYITQALGTTLTNNGTIEGGSGNGWAIHAEGAGDTALINNGTITALSSNALLFGGGDDTVSNFGRIEGDVDMGAGNNAFTNEATGELVLWDEFTLVSGVAVGAGTDTKVAVAGELSNNGLLYVYGDGAIGTSVINGNLYQSELGTLVFDADAASFTTDYLVVNGDADLNGVIRLNLQNVPVNLDNAPDFPTDLFSYSIIRANSLNTGAGLTFDPAELTIENTVAYTFALRAENGEIIVDVIEMTSNFEDMLDGLATTYQKGFAQYLDRQQGAADTTAIQPLVDVLRNLPDASALQASFNAFAPVSVAAQDRMLRDDARSMLGSTPGCDLNGEARVCLAAGTDYGETSGDLNLFSEDYDADRTSLALGLGVSISENWQLGVSARIGSDDFRLPGDVSADQDGYLIAAGVEGTVLNGLELGVTGVIGNMSADVSRASMLSTTTRLTSAQEARVEGVSAQVAYPIVANGWIITPALQASNVCLDADEFSEQGGLADAIVVDAHASCQTSIGPRLGFETPDFELAGFDARAFVNLGYDAIDDDALLVSASLLSAGLADDRFETAFEGDGDSRTSAQFGLQGRTESGWLLRASAGLSETDTQSSWAAGLSFSHAL